MTAGRGAPSGTGRVSRAGGGAGGVVVQKHSCGFSSLSTLHRQSGGEGGKRAPPSPKQEVFQKRVLPREGSGKELSPTANWSPPTACSCFLGKQPSPGNTRLPLSSVTPTQPAPYSLGDPPRPPAVPIIGTQLLPHPCLPILTAVSYLFFFSFFQTHQPPGKLLLTSQTPQVPSSLVPRGTSQHLLRPCLTPQLRLCARHWWSWGVAGETGAPQSGDLVGDTKATGHLSPGGSGSEPSGTPWV